MGISTRKLLSICSILCVLVSHTAHAKNSESQKSILKGEIQSGNAQNQPKTLSGTIPDSLIKAGEIIIANSGNQKSTIEQSGSKQTLPKTQQSQDKQLVNSEQNGNVLKLTLNRDQKYINGNSHVISSTVKGTKFVPTVEEDLEENVKLSNMTSLPSGHLTLESEITHNESEDIQVHDSEEDNARQAADDSNGGEEFTEYVSEPINEVYVGKYNPHEILTAGNINTINLSTELLGVDLSVKLPVNNVNLPTEKQVVGMAEVRPVNVVKLPTEKHRVDLTVAKQNNAAPVQISIPGVPGVSIPEKNISLDKNLLSNRIIIHNKLVEKQSPTPPKFGNSSSIINSKVPNKLIPQNVPEDNFQSTNPEILHLESSFPSPVQQSVKPISSQTDKIWQPPLALNNKVNRQKVVTEAETETLNNKNSISLSNTHLKEPTTHENVPEKVVKVNNGARGNVEKISLAQIAPAHPKLLPQLEQNTLNNGLDSNGGNKSDNTVQHPKVVLTSPEAGTVAENEKNKPKDSVHPKLRGQISSSRVEVTADKEFQPKKTVHPKLRGQISSPRVEVTADKVKEPEKSAHPKLTGQISSGVKVTADKENKPEESVHPKFTGEISSGIEVTADKENKPNELIQPKVRDQISSSEVEIVPTKENYSIDGDGVKSVADKLYLFSQKNNENGLINKAIHDVNLKQNQKNEKIVASNNSEESRQKVSNSVAVVSIIFISAVTFVTVIGLYYKKISFSRKRYGMHMPLSTDDDEDMAVFNRQTNYDAPQYESWRHII